eukprot:SAG22_NODE_17286_length_308_cov_0.492823_2_plen_41_part_01
MDLADDEGAARSTRTVTVSRVVRDSNENVTAGKRPWGLGFR